MDHIKISFAISDQSEKDILIAYLEEAGYDGFEEMENGLLAYISADQFDQSKLESIAELVGKTYQQEGVPMQNWNALWESNFQPVIIDDFCTIRAHFHHEAVTTPYEIVITPKMSFGTGHHATTRQMMLLMKDLNIKDKTVFDFGTGTGVLAILAEKLGATQILAIDNDEWSIENANENIQRNGCTRIATQLGSLEDVTIAPVDIILANINRHILLQYMTNLFSILNESGIMLMSGLLTDDEEIILNSATVAGFRHLLTTDQNGWIAIKLTK